MRLLILILLFISQVISAQNPEINKEKYWNYRKRLNYFVVNGDPSVPGMNCVASERNAWSTGAISYGQHMINFGYYLGVLATEYALYKNDTIYANSVRKELENALKTYIRLDMCENWERWGFDSAKFDGFFMREDVPSDFAIKYKNELNLNLSEERNPLKSGKIGFVAFVDEVNSYDKECPIYLNGRDKWNPKSNIVSQDEVIGILMGLAIVKKCFPKNSYEYKTSQLIAEKLLEYIRNFEKIHGKRRWRLYRPDGVMIDYNLGSDARAYSYGFSKSVEWITEKDLKNYYSCYEKLRCKKFLWNSFQFAGVSSTHAHMVATLAAIGNSWTFFGVNRTGKGIKTVSKIELWQPFYVTLWNFLQDKNTPFLKKEVEFDLNSAPYNGPYYLNDTTMTNQGGWASSAKYWHTKKEQFNGTAHWFSGLYNGLDYMLMYNLYLLTNKE